MSPELNSEVHRQLQHLSSYLEKVLRLVRVIVELFLAVLTLVMRGIRSLAHYAEPYVHQTSRFIRMNTIATARRTKVTMRKLREAEKSFEPAAIEAVPIMI